MALEYDVRLGDPESQALCSSLGPETDLAAMLLACTNSTLHMHRLSIVNFTYSVAVVVVAEGYPDAP